MTKTATKSSSVRTVHAPGGPMYVFGMRNTAYVPKGASNQDGTEVAKNPQDDFVEGKVVNKTIEDVFDAYYDEEIPQGQRVSFDDIFENHETNVNALREQLKYLKEHGSPEDVNEFAFAISNSQEYQDIVFTKENGRALRKLYGDKGAELNRDLSKAIEDGKRKDYCVNGANDVKSELSSALKGDNLEEFDKDRFDAINEAVYGEGCEPKELNKENVSKIIEDIDSAIKEEEQKAALRKKNKEDEPDDYFGGRLQGLGILRARDTYDNYQKAEAYEDDFKGTGRLLEDYQNIITDALHYSHEERDTSDVITEFTGDRMGEMYMFADTEPGSREWHEARQTGFGGSDMGAFGSEWERRFDENGDIIEFYKEKVDRKTGEVEKIPLPGEKNEHYIESLEEIWNSKVNPVSDDQIAPQNVDNFDNADAALRGHGQEEIIGEMAARRDGLKLMHNKGTWTRDGSSININYDFMLTSDGVHPDGNFEIKTASDPTHWGKESLGIDGIPLNYRAQVLAGCLEAGFPRGGLAVLINGRELRVYQFEMTPELIAEAQANKERADEAYRNVEEARATGETEFKRENVGLPPKKEWPKGDRYSKGMLSKGLAGDKGRLFRRIASMRRQKVQEVKQEFVDSMPLDKKSWSTEKIKRGLDRLYVRSGAKMLKNKLVRGADIEATDLAASRGRIIEIGVTSVDMETGEFKNNYSELFDVPPAHKYGKGTGAEDVHNISLKDIEGKRRIDDESIHPEIVAEFEKDGGTVFAHNMSYERQFLRGNLKGLAEKEFLGLIRFVDTMDIIKHTMPGSKNNKLESFVEENGDKYVNAHRALQDTKMMMRAVRKYFSGFFGGNKELRELAAEG